MLPEDLKESRFPRNHVDQGILTLATFDSTADVHSALTLSQQVFPSLYEPTFGRRHQYHLARTVRSLYRIPQTLTSVRSLFNTSTNILICFRMAEDNISAVLYGIGDLRLEQRPIPQAGPGQLLIRCTCFVVSFTFPVQSSHRRNLWF